MTRLSEMKSVLSIFAVGHEESLANAAGLWIFPSWPPLSLSGADRRNSDHKKTEKN